MSHNIDLHDPAASDSCSFLLRSRWPYVLGAIASAMFALSILIVLAAEQVHGGRGGGLAAVFAIRAMALAAVLLGVSWLGVLRGGQGGAGPIVGSFAVSLVFAYLDVGGGSSDLYADAALIVGAFSLFSWGHVVAPCGGAVRWLAAMSALLWSLLFVALQVTHDSPELFARIAFGATALPGIGLVFAFPRLRYASPPHAHP